jgi:hypothetical protein
MAKKENTEAAICNPHMLQQPKATIKALGLPFHGSAGRFSHNFKLTI